MPELLRPRSLLVLNDTRVIPARLYGKKATGGAVEILLVRRLDQPDAPAPTPFDSSDASAWSEDWEVLARALGTQPPGARLVFGSGPGARLEAEVLSRGERGAAALRFQGRGAGGLLSAAERLGVLPLPPYIEAARKRDGAEGRGPDEPLQKIDDRERYQTVYAARPGAIAAPTAGLHFTEPLLRSIAEAGHEIARVTLHVGPGTFRPVEVDDVREHHMDHEEYEVSAAAAEAIERARSESRPVVAVGTTVVRTLESLAAAGPVRAGRGSTDLFLYPGKEFRIVTDLVTNFHLPRSTLLMLVAAFAGRESVLAAYEEAIALGYRFYSYGDAMFITPQAIGASR